MPQLNLLRDPQPLVFSVAVAIPLDPAARSVLGVEVRGRDGRAECEAHWSLIGGVDLCDVGVVLSEGWRQFWYGEPTGVPEVFDRSLRENGLTRSHVRRR